MPLTSCRFRSTIASLCRIYISLGAKHTNKKRSCDVTLVRVRTNLSALIANLSVLFAKYNITSSLDPK